MENSLILKLLSEVKLFEEFGPGDMQDFLGKTTGCTYERGDEILSEGEPGRQMHIILTGKVEVFRKSNGKTVRLVKLGPGESFGEMSLVMPANEGRTASIRAVERTATLRIDHESLLRVPGVALKLYRNIARTLATRLKISTDLVVFQAQHGSRVPASETLGPRSRPTDLADHGS